MSKSPRAATKADAREAARDLAIVPRPDQHGNPLRRLQRLAGNRALGTLQTALPVAPLNDPREAEADRIAAGFGTLAEPHPRHTPAATAPATAPASAHDELRRPGRPLEPSVRSFFEARLGHDLSAVRIHADATSDGSARAVRAQAYTVGQDVVFAGGRFAPHTTEGQQLLAHELTHVAQQSAERGSGAAAGPVLHRKPDPPAHARLPPQPVKETARAEMWSHIGDYYHLLIDDIQWFLSFWHQGYDLVVFAAAARRKTLSVATVAQTCVDILAAGVGLPLRNHGVDLVDHVATQLENYWSGVWDAFLLIAPFDLVRQQFDPTDFETYWQEVQSEITWGQQPLLAAGSFATGKKGAKAGRRKGGDAASRAQPDQPGWVTRQHEKAQELLAAARRQPQRPADLPDRIVLWYNDRDDNWWVNAWTSVDPQGKQKRVHSFRLEPEDTPDDLLEKARAAAVEALQRGEDKDKRAREQLAPAWARQLERDVKHRLADERAHAKGDGDFPDGMVLVPGPDVQFQIWVERGKLPNIERNYGAVPLVPAATVDQVVPYVRHLAAMLRQFEQTPLDVALAAPTAADILLQDPAKFGLNAFPAEVVPVDLRRDNITVTSATNQFHMQMNYEAVYGAGGDLYIASKLYSQTIHFYWEVYPVPSDLPPPPREKTAPLAWSRRWQWLYDSYNPIDAQGRRTKRTVSVAGTPLTKTDDRDSTSRVRMPSTAGDYLVRCVTGHTPIGDEKLKRQPSEGFYPVRVRPIEDVAKESASVRTGAIAAVEQELQTIGKLLAEGKLRDNEKQMLLAKQQIRSGDLARMRSKETQTLQENTTAELAYANQTLANAKALKDLLPGILQRAVADGVAPHELLKDRPELVRLYWSLIFDGKTPEAYIEELDEKVKLLQGLHDRATAFASELKSSSRYQYTPEAAFVSEVTGHVYPLVFMLGEAPDTVKLAMSRARSLIGLPDLSGVAYSLIDVTSKQTRKVYYGYSPNSGAKGHREAIADAFAKFGDDAMYGEGLVAVRIPPGSAGASDENYPGAEIKIYRSKEGILQKVLWALGIIGAVAGLAALAATGVGAPVAAGILGVIAAAAGAISALHNIEERQRRHSLELDAELVLDIISIVGVVPAVAGARAAVQTAAGLRVAIVTERFLQIYTWTEGGATVLLVPTKLYQDIERIEADTELTPDQKQLMIAQARLGAVQSGLMLVGSVAAAHAGASRSRSRGEGGKGGGVLGDEHNAAVRDQIKLLELEGFGEYQSMRERGWIDADGHWTDKAPDVVRNKPAATTTEPPAPDVASAPTAEPPAAEGQTPTVTKAPPPKAKKEPGTRFRFGMRTIDQNGKLTNEGVQELRRAFPSDFAGATDQQVKDAYARDISISRRGAYHEALVKLEVGEVYGTSKDAWVASAGKNLNNIIGELQTRTPGSVTDTTILDQNAGRFARGDPVLKAAIAALNTHKDPGVRAGWREWFARFSKGKVGAKKPDVIEFLPDRNLAVVSDPTLAVPSEFGPIHEFKTLFYKRVLERCTGFEVGAMDIAPGLVSIIGE